MIPFKKSQRPYISYLEKNEIDVLLNLPDCSTHQGQRDHALLLLLYNTGARADEIATIKVADLSFSGTKKGLSSVLINGKGAKQRRCPLWAQTVNELKILILNRKDTENIFLNRRSEPLTRFGIYRLIKQYAKTLINRFPDLENKRISPHIIRHTTATHLLRAGVDINTIRAWLGHVSINTTNIYAEIELEMKEKALKLCEITKSNKFHGILDSQSIMGFLKSI